MNSMLKICLSYFKNTSPKNNENWPKMVKVETTGLWKVCFSRKKILHAIKDALCMIPRGNSCNLRRRQNNGKLQSEKNIISLSTNLLKSLLELKNSISDSVRCAINIIIRQVLEKRAGIYKFTI